jgi:inner membrane protein
MPTILSHAIVAAAAAQWWRRVPARFWFWTVVCPMLPDIDVVGFAFGIRYDDMFGHRGFTHSLFFAAATGLVAAIAVARHAPEGGALEIGGWKPGVIVLWAWFTSLTMTHGLLDALTNGGRGIAFFSPLSNERYFFPWRPILVSPIGAGFFSARGLRVLVSESMWIWLPSAIIAIAARVVRRR